MLRRFISSLPVQQNSELIGPYPSGFVWSAVGCGIKKLAKGKARERPLDLVVLHSKSPCVAAGTFTKNIFKAAPVRVSQAVLRSAFNQNIHSVVINSGCANAVTGETGDRDARRMAEAVNERITQVANSALVMSTGVIGVKLPMDKVEAGIKLARDELGAAHMTNNQMWFKAAQGIMTTDTFPKVLTRKVHLAQTGESFVIAGICKGAGMIQPNMATMLAVICTDLDISPSCLQSITSTAVDASFNCITVDGDMSTNDTCFVLANGEARSKTGGQRTRVTTIGDDLFREVESAFTLFAQDLARLIVRDGEGASKLITVNVQGVKSVADAKLIARNICNSLLVKTAFYGQDANWGRILAAIGSADLGYLNPRECSLRMTAGEQSITLVEHGEPLHLDEAAAGRLLREKDIEVHVAFAAGKHGASLWTCDLSEKYVQINADYRS